MRRRGWLTLGALLLVATAARRVHAAETEVEGAAYGGTTEGGWACGPIGRANYGGVGAGVRSSERGDADKDGNGMTATVIGAGEYEHVTITDTRCEDPGNCSPDRSIAPADHVMLGIAGKAGYRWRFVGIQGGAQVYQQWEHNTDNGPSASALPNAEISLGRRDKIHGEVGLGAPTVTAGRRPGAYVGMGTTLRNRHGLHGYVGIFRAGPSKEGAWRGDVVYRAPLSEQLHLRVGASASDDPARAGSVGGEASVGAAATF